MNERSAHAGPVRDVDLVARAWGDSTLQRVLPEDRIDIRAAGAVVVDTVPVAGKRTARHRRARSLEHGQGAGAVLRVILGATEQADEVDAQIGDVTDEQAVLERREAAVQQVQRRPRRLRPVVTEDAVAEQHGVLRAAEMLDGHPAAARARVVAENLDILDDRVRSRVDLDAAAVGIEEGRLANLVGLDGRLFAYPGGEVVGAGDLESAKPRLA